MFGFRRGRRPVSKRRIRKVLVLYRSLGGEDMEVGKALTKAGFEVVQMPYTREAREQLDKGSQCVGHSFCMIVLDGQGVEVGDMIQDFGIFFPS